MMRIVEALTFVQETRLKNRTLTPEDEEEIGRLCANVPAPLLQRFERFVARGKKAVATVRSGVCSECHLRLPSGTVAALAYTNEIHYCDNCGRVLHLPENEPLEALPQKSPPSATKPRKTRAVARP